MYKKIPQRFFICIAFSVLFSTFVAASAKNAMADVYQRDNYAQEYTINSFSTELTKELQYTVAYYKNGVHVSGDDVVVTKTVDINATTLPIDPVNCSNDKYDGYYFSRITPDITSVLNMESNCIIQVYYEIAPSSKTYTLTVKWISDNGTELAPPVTTTLIAGESYNTEQKTFENFNFQQVQGDSSSGTMDSNRTVTYIYYSIGEDSIIEIPDDPVPIVSSPTLTEDGLSESSPSFLTPSVGKEDTTAQTQLDQNPSLTTEIIDEEAPLVQNPASIVETSADSTPLSNQKETNVLYIVVIIGTIIALILLIVFFIKIKRRNA